MTSSEALDIWSVVLAAGDGRRLAPLVRRLHGDDRPKQFAILKGRRSLLQDTLDRGRALVPPRRTVVVVPQRHLHLAVEQVAREHAAELIAQPRNVGTGPGVLLPLAHVLAAAPEATVVITPSDHHFTHPERFLAKLPQAVRAATVAPAGVCLIAVEADSPSSDLGWIVPGSALLAGPGARTISSFVEKPSSRVADTLFQQGALWNTFVMVGRARSFWQLAREHLPAQARRFERYQPAIGGPREREARDSLYDDLSVADFSQELLARATGLAVVSASGSGWSDWGTAERIIESIASPRERVAFQELLATAP